ncbi:MAG: aldehyde dehydrogenase family protein, partial [bacterium]|nr:aldehyde dehydrogenase family protein [bacterium]
FIALFFQVGGFPRVVFNVVLGGGVVGGRLVAHKKVKGILFVGSDATGQKILQAVQGAPEKICVLEMGGKNAAIVFPDADWEGALEACLRSALATTGQRCTSLSRLILHRSIAKKFTERFVEAMASLPVGHYLDPKARMGPLVDSGAQKKFLRYQKLATREGAKVLLSGKKLKLKHPGYYVSPGVHSISSGPAKKIKAGYRYDEIFGPDVAIYTFGSLEEAVHLHNDSRYGLVASVFTASKKRFRELLPRLEVGNLFWNRPTIGASGKLPFGGIKASGNHFPAGLFSPYFCTYPLAIQE